MEKKELTKKQNELIKKEKNCHMTAKFHLTESKKTSLSLVLRDYHKAQYFVYEAEAAAIFEQILALK